MMGLQGRCCTWAMLGSPTPTGRQRVFAAQPPHPNASQPEGREQPGCHGRKEAAEKETFLQRGGGRVGGAAALGGGGDTSCGSMGLRDGWRTPSVPTGALCPPPQPHRRAASRQQCLQGLPHPPPPNIRAAPFIHPSPLKQTGGGAVPYIHPIIARPGNGARRQRGGLSRTSWAGGGGIVEKLQSAFGGEGALITTPPPHLHTHTHTPGLL